MSLESSNALESTFDILKKAGVTDDVAFHTSKGLWTSSMKGVDSHGLRLLPHYIQSCISGRITKSPNYIFNDSNSSTSSLDADHTFGHAAGVKAMNKAIQLAKNSGIGAVSVFNSSHCGALSFFSEIACENNMIGLAFTHATPKVQAHNSREVFLGTNPICFAAPMKSEGPFCYDSASTSFTFNKIRQFRDLNKTLPEGIATSQTGELTTDPHLAMQLLPIGGHKGFGLAMIVDILCGLLSSMPVGNDVSEMFGNDLGSKRFLGQFYMAIDIRNFVDPEIFKERLQDTARKVRKLTPMNGETEVMIPGDPEKKSWEKRNKEGIPIPNKIFDELNELSKKLKSKTFSTA